MSLYYAGVRLCSGCSIAVRDAKAAKKARTASKRAPRVEAKRRERTLRADFLESIRSTLSSETDHRCAVCRAVLGQVAGYEAHHIISGSLRRACESVETMAPLCTRCHQLAHRGDLDTLIRLGAWCEKTKRTEAREALYRRVNKIEEARR
jgi:predicted HNH restriction endonuclease